VISRLTSIGEWFGGAGTRLRWFGLRPLQDPLTGLARRQALHAALERELDSIGTGDAPPAGVLVVDLDRLKLINDAYGHQFGDLVLVEAATRLQAAVGIDDLVARLGGDEFGVLARSARTERGLRELARRLRMAVAAEPIVVNGKELMVTATVGASSLTPSTTVFEALARADQQMYVSKGTAGADAFDRVSELIVGVLEADDDGVDAAFVSGIAEVAHGRRAYVDTGQAERWWPDEPEGEAARKLRRLAREAQRRNEVVEGGEWRIAAPLRGDGHAIGAFAVERDYPFAKADQIALARAGVALGQALLRLKETVAARRRISELEHLAFRDENTGLANRRALLAELARHELREGPLSLLFLDFDGLRAVNNTISYERGNDLLRVVTSAIESTLAHGELAARLHGSGGDEFIIVCPGIDELEASRRACELEHALAPGELPLDGDLEPLYGGASVGYAVRRPDEESLAFVERAAAEMRGRKRLRKARAEELPAA